MRFFFVGYLFFFTLEAFCSHHLQLLGQWNNRARAQYNDIWGYEDSNGDEYALLGVRNGTSVIDIRNPLLPKEISFIPSANSIWKDIKTYQHYAYVVNESGGGLQIIDLSKLPESASLVATYKGFQTSHNLYIDTQAGILYAEGNHAQPIRVFDLQNPLKPQLIQFFGVECHDLHVQDGIAVVSEGGHGTIGIYDVSNPYDIHLMNRFEIPNSGYVHNSWLSEDGLQLITTEETPGKTIKLWDFKKQGKSQLIDEYLAPNGLAHNAFIKDGYAFISHYGSGLRILKLQHGFEEVAYFSPTERNPRGYLGSWGVYPFFQSNKILLSNIESGLYILEFKK